MCKCRNKKHFQSKENQFWGLRCDWLKDVKFSVVYISDLLDLLHALYLTKVIGNVVNILPDLCYETNSIALPQMWIFQNKSQLVVDFSPILSSKIELHFGKQSISKIEVSKNCQKSDIFKWKKRVIKNWASFQKTKYFKNWS